MAKLINATTGEQLDELFICSHCAGILVDPYQLACGDRVCYSCICMDRQEKRPIKCVRCGEVTQHEQCHEDKACSKDIKKLQVKCGWRGCEWSGKYSEGNAHQDQCEHAVECCGYCGRQLTRAEMLRHLNTTNYHDGCSLLHRPCLFEIFGCNFEGNTYQLARHDHEERQYHYHLCELFRHLQL